MTAIFVAHLIFIKDKAYFFNFSEITSGGTDIETYIETLRTNDA